MRARHPRLFSRFALVPALLTLSACATPDKVALKEYAPKSPDADIEAVSLSASDKDTFDPQRVGTEFPDSIRQVAVWYRWNGADSGKKIGIRWSKSSDVILEQGDTLANAAGTSAYVLKMAAGSKLPTGSYEVELLENGVVVTSIPFKVGDAGESETAAAPAHGESQAASVQPEAAAPAEEEPHDQPAAAAATDETPAADTKPASAPAGTAAGGRSAQETKWPGITAQITELARKGKILSAKVRFTNNGDKKVRPEFYYTDTYLLDADNKKYEVLKDEKGTYLGSLTTGYPNWWGEYLDPGTSQTVWMRFPAPPAGVTVLTLQVAGMDPFEDVPVQN